MNDLLLIDDDRELTELLATWLQQEGFQVAPATTAPAPAPPSPGRRRTPWCST